MDPVVVTTVAVCSTVVAPSVVPVTVVVTTSSVVVVASAVVVGTVVVASLVVTTVTSPVVVASVVVSTVNKISSYLEECHFNPIYSLINYFIFSNFPPLISFSLPPRTRSVANLLSFSSNNNDNNNNIGSIYIWALNHSLTHLSSRGVCSLCNQYVLQH